MSMRSAGDIDLSRVDIFDIDLFRNGPPHEVLAEMRKENPVRWCPFADDGMWALTGYREIAAVSRDTKTFSSARKGVMPNPDQGLPLNLMQSFMILKDPPDHDKYRKIVQSVFHPRTVATLEPEVRRIVTQAIDDVIGRGTCDFVADLATPLPLRVLAELLIGMSPGDVPQFERWMQEVEDAIVLGYEGGMATDTFLALAGFLQEQIRVQTERGDEDSVVMRLQRTEVDGDRLSYDEVFVIFGMLSVAAIDTTRNTIATGMLALLQHPDQLQRLSADPALLPGAIEEILRWTSVVNYFCRTATQDTKIREQPIAEGERVIMWYSAGCRDEAVFEDPQRFDIARRNASEHQAFGGGGKHICLGASLARLELRVFFDELLRRLPDIEVTGEPELLVSNFIHGIKRMPVSFTPA